MSGCAFSISSKRITLYGLRRIRSVSCPPSSWPDVARGRADELRDGVLLHVLRHVEADERLLVLEQELRQPPRDLGLAHARRARGR